MKSQNLRTLSKTTLIIVLSILTIYATKAYALELFNTQKITIEVGGQTLKYTDAGDIDGDGYQDVLISVSRISNGENYEGKLEIYYGTPQGLSTTPGWTIEGNEENRNLGNQIAGGGDINGDGYDDIAVKSYESGTQATISIFLGSASGMANNPSWTFAQTGLGEDMSLSGDYNNDGYDDLVLGFLGAYNKALVFYGSSTGFSDTPDLEITPNFGGSNETFGSQVENIGDVNGDNYDDLLISDFLYSGASSYSGISVIYYGSSTGLQSTPQWTYEGLGEMHFLGTTLHALGDANGDGYDDFILGVAMDWMGSFYTDDPRYYVFYGSDSGPSSSFDLEIINMDFIIDGATNYIHSPADINDDGYYDFITYGMGMDSTFIYTGSETGLSTTSFTSFGTPLDPQSYGYSPIYIQDINKNGYPELLSNYNQYIYINEIPTKTVSIPTSSSTITERNETINIPVNISEAVSEDITINYTFSGTANSYDYISNNNSLTIPSGQTSSNIQFNLIDDSNVENTETIIITLTSANHATLNNSNIYTLTILDNDQITLPEPQTPYTPIYTYTVQTEQEEPEVEEEEEEIEELEKEKESVVIINLQDQDGNPLISQEVVLFNGEKYITDKDGNITLTNIDPGSYSLTLENNGKEEIFTVNIKGLNDINNPETITITINKEMESNNTPYIVIPIILLLVIIITTYIIKNKQRQ